MRSSIRCIVPLGVAVALAALVAVAVLCSPALTGDRGNGNPNPGIMPPQSKHGGASYGEWAAACWQWVFSIPADSNPILDPDGEFAAVGQSGEVWFLIGTFGGKADRTVTVPAGKSLFFPVVNYVWVNTPETGEELDWSEHPEAREAAIAECKSAIDGVIAAGLTCEIDGRPVKDLASYRCQAPNFAVDFAENNIWAEYGVAEGLHPNSIDDGVYLMLAPLSAGKHTIHFTAGDFLDVTYHITVAGGK